MNLLLDTHTLLWFALDDVQLSSAAKSLVLDPSNRKFCQPCQLLGNRH
jgi:PIN domain nuclease of toxin-antitoxin system